MRKIISLLLAAAIFIGGVPVHAEESKEYAAKAVILAEISTGQVLYSMNPDEHLPIASVTKIMTLLLTAEAIKSGKMTMDTIITASEHANSMDGSVIWLNAGEEMSAFDLIRSVVISSANDACVAIAEYIAGSEELFVGMMNERAKSLGMLDTNFIDCTGLTDDENHYSTASDVAKMASELRKYDYFDSFLLTRLTYVREGTDRATQLLNTNKLLNRYEGITGLKTGTTDRAGYCFVATAKRGDMELVAVVLGSNDENERFRIAESLLDYGFDGFELFVPEYDSEKLIPVNVARGIKKTVFILPEEGHSCLIPKGSSGNVTYLYDLRDRLEAPVEKGAKAGKIIVLLGEETLFVCEVKAADAVEELTLLKCFELVLRAMFCF